MDKRITDREVYPAVWITVAILLCAGLIWKFLLGEPALAGCWVYQNWHLYCPGCGGTRALLALLQGRLLQAGCYHPAVPVTFIWLVVYLLSQTVWRLRGRQGWALCYKNWWPVSLFVLLIVHCIFRNILLLGFGIGI